MAKRTIKPAAGESRISLHEATSAARTVYRDGTTGRLVVLERDRSGHIRDSAGVRSKETFKEGGNVKSISNASGKLKERKDSASRFEGVRKKR
jgi:hypothetical protein